MMAYELFSYTFFRILNYNRKAQIRQFPHQGICLLLPVELVVVIPSKIPELDTLLEDMPDRYQHGMCYCYLSPVLSSPYRDLAVLGREERALAH